MATFKPYQVTALPGTLTPNSVYYVAPAARPDYIEIFVTGNDAGTVKRVIDEARVTALINAALASAGSPTTLFVATYAELLSLDPENAQTAYVVDASGDPTVNSGAATYIYRQSDDTWLKQSEAESLDIALTWEGLTGTPSSTPAQIDTAVSQSHVHANKTQLDKIDENGSGDFTYNGAYPKIEWNSTGW